MIKTPMDVFWVGLVVFAFLLAFADMVLSAERLHPDKKSAYHWWSYACCDEDDCGPATEGQVKVTDKGYIVTTPDGEKHLLHWKDTRIKKKPADNPYAYDGKHHVCQDTNYSGWYVRCLYPAFQGG